MEIIPILAILLLVVFLLVVVVTLISRYRMCPPDRVLVVYGKLATAFRRAATTVDRPS